MEQLTDKNEAQKELAEILERYGLVVTAFAADGTVIVAEAPVKDEPRRAIN